jgi:urea carboxylase-associated protein 1
MSAASFVTSPYEPSHAVYTAVIPAGESWVHPIKKGQIFRIVDIEGNQAVDTLFYNEHDFEDRYDFQKTITTQGNIYLSTGSVLMSSKGNPLLTIIADTCGRHDTLGGACATESNQVRYALEKGHMHACRQSFLQALLTFDGGIEKRDIPNNINFFMNVPVTPDGKLTFADGISEPGKYVELRAERDVLGLISNCPQLNNPCNAYNPTPVQVLIWNTANV